MSVNKASETFYNEHLYTHVHAAQYIRWSLDIFKIRLDSNNELLLLVHRTDDKGDKAEGALTLPTGNTTNGGNEYMNLLQAHVDKFFHQNSQTATSEEQIQAHAQLQAQIQSVIAANNNQEIMTEKVQYVNDEYLWNILYPKQFVCEPVDTSLDLYAFYS